MSQAPQWRRHRLPDDLTVTHVVTGAYGLALFGGTSGDGRAALAFTWPNMQVTDLDGAGLLALASNGANIIAATADGGSYEIDPPIHFDTSVCIRRENLPRDPAGQLPVMAWASAADREFRLVLAYSDAAGYRLEIFSDAWEGLVESDNSLYARDLTGVQVTAHQGVLLVGGPVSEDAALAQGCQVWLCDEPDYGGGKWARRSLTPPPATLTHQVDGAVDWWWAGDDGHRVVIWHEDTEVPSPPVAIIGTQTRTFLAQTPFGDSGPTLATQTENGSHVRWQEDGHWVEAQLPQGLLTGALRSPRQTKPAPEVPERLHVIVDDKAWWMDWEDVRRLGR